MGMVWGFRAGTGRPRELSQLGSKRNSLGNSLFGLVVRTWSFHYWDQIPFLVGELSSSQLHGAAKKKKKIP